jgi:hypothetical protein
MGNKKEKTYFRYCSENTCDSTKQKLLDVKIEFARAAMQGMLSGEWAAKSNVEEGIGDHCEFKDEEAIAYWAWMYAHDMMKQLENEEFFELSFPESDEEENK